MGHLVLSVVVAFCLFMLQSTTMHMLWQNYRSLKSQDGEEKSLMMLLNQFYAEFEEIEATEISTYLSILKSAKEISS